MKSGWGITSNDKYLIATDGSDLLFFIDPETMKVTSKLNVYEITGGSKYFVKNLNEVEYVDGFVYANQF